MLSLRTLTLWAVAAGAAAQALPPGFEPQASGVTARLRGISAVSERVAWASGADGTVLRTLDGGATWAAIPISGAESMDFRDIDAISDRVAYALSIGRGEASRIYKTVDGGSNWTLQLANKDPNVFLDAMAFWDASHGIAFSDSVDGQLVIFRTTDGQTWQRLPSAGLPPALSGEGAFAASGTNVAVHGRDRVWVGTGAARVLRSADGGRTWAVSTAPLATSASAGIFSIAFRDATHGIVVGGDYQKETEAVDNVAITSDGGVTWTRIKGPGLSGYRSVVAAVPGEARTWIAVGPSGADISSDDGHTWSPLKSEGYDTLSFAPGKPVGWAAGSRGRLAKMIR